MRPVGLPQGAPPKFQGHSSRSRDPSGIQADGEQSHRTVNAKGEAEWSKALSLKGFNSIWNCGGAREDTGTTSPIQLGSPREGGVVSSSQHRPVFEGRDSNYRQTREAGVSSRA